MYELPQNLVRQNERWMWRQWGKNGATAATPCTTGGSTGADALRRPPHARRLRAHARPKRAHLFYVPLFLNQRVTWGADLASPMRAAVSYLSHAYPYWNASGGRDHVFFIFGERQTCLVPAEIRESSILIGHWGDVDCMSDQKDVVVPTITPVQHDLPRFAQRLQPAMRKASAANFTRTGPLLLFAGGIVAFSASQDNLRKGGLDTEEKRLKWLKRVNNDPCANPAKSCRHVYSMGVRQAVEAEAVGRARHAHRLRGHPRLRHRVPNAHFCLHTEGNGWARASSTTWRWNASRSWSTMV